MNHFLRGLITEWRRLELPFAGETVVVGVSGGADSVSLLLGIDELNRLGKLDLRIVAAHFDHKLRPGSSGDDLEFVRRLTVARKIELAAGEWEERRNGNLEQAARKARYHFLRSTADRLRSGYILTGHTMNDQAETVLMNLIRGSGIEGLGGMRPIRETAEGPAVEAEVSAGGQMLPFPASAIRIVRPLLRWAKRRDTEDLCHQNEVAFCLDPMNEDLTFRRVWIRKVLLPMIEEVNPKIVDSLCRTAELLQRAAAISEDMESHDISGPDDDDGGLSVKYLNSLERGERLDAIRKWLRARRGDLRGLQLNHIEAIERLANGRKSGKYVELPRRGRVSKAGGLLRFGEIKVDN